MTDEDYMRVALELAEKGRGWVNPNPMVGAVIVKDDRIIGQGWHRRYGELHAERNALADCIENPAGATMYVTLEPCCHQGKTPPCTDALLEAGIGRVVVGAMDTNPLVGGKGALLLQQHGVQVETGILEEECRRQNRIFFHYMERGLPYVVLKYAMTLDGKIATVTGESKWITGAAAREQVHHLRHEMMGIMVGSGTVFSDNPMLNCRISGLKNPVRIICDTRLRTPLDAAVVRTAGEQRTILVTACGQQERQEKYHRAGCEILTVPLLDGHLNLRILMQELGQQKIDSILLEGGGTLSWSALSCGIVNEIQAYISPKVFGGEGAKSPVAGKGVPVPGAAFGLEETKVQRIDEDFLVTGRVTQKGGKPCLPGS